MQEITKRLNEFISSLKISKAEFARRVDLKPQNINGYLNGDLDAQNLFIKLFDMGCDINWLISGKIADNNNNEKIEIEKLKAIITELKQVIFELYERKKD